MQKNSELSQEQYKNEQRVRELEQEIESLKQEKEYLSKQKEHRMFELMDTKEK